MIRQCCLPLALLSVLSTCQATCTETNLTKPIASQEGDYLIAAVFTLGEVVLRTGDDGREAEECSYENTVEDEMIYGLQMAIFLRKTIQMNQPRFKEINATLGYLIYDSCSSLEVASKVSFEIASNDRVIGVAGVDDKSFIKKSAGITTTKNIPTFVYNFNDDDLMTEASYPSLFSIIDTEQTEAKIIIAFLEGMGYTYMDIWHDEFSVEMAKFIHRKYLRLRKGCGRSEFVTHRGHFPKIKEKYNSTGGTPSQIQLILMDDGPTTEAMLEHMIVDLGFKDKIYILRMANGREKHMEKYIKILQEHGSGKDTIITPVSWLASAHKPEPKTYPLARNWTTNEDEIDELYRITQTRKCQTNVDTATNASNMVCPISSYLPYIAGGIQLIAQSLYENLDTKRTGTTSSCIDDLREKVYTTIVAENRTVEVDLHELGSHRFVLKNRTVNIGYKGSVYRSQTDEYNYLGTVFPDNMRITDLNMTLLKLISYNRTCSHTCTKGYHQLLPLTEGGGLMCCYKCQRCLTNTFTSGPDEKRCQRCGGNETSNMDKTGCEPTLRSFIKPSSGIFLGGVACVVVGLILVLACGGIILWYKDGERPVIKASGLGYLYMVLLSIGVGMCTSILPLVRPSNAVCALEYFGMTVFVTTITTNLAWKCTKIYGIFAAANDFTAPRCGPLLSSAGQLWLNVGSLVIVLVLAAIDRLLPQGSGWSFGELQLYDHEPFYLTCQCASSRDIPITLCLLILPTLYFLLTLLLTFKMRSFPHNFRETMNIFMAGLIVFMCCVIFLGGYSWAHPYIRPVLRAVVVYVSCLAFLICLFLPKMVVLLRTNVEQERAKQRESMLDFSLRASPRPSPRRSPRPQSLNI